MPGICASTYKSTSSLFLAWRQGCDISIQSLAEFHMLAITGRQDQVLENLDKNLFIIAQGTVLWLLPRLQIQSPI